jgi:hypothetical protein
MNNIIKELIIARDLIKDPKHWTQGAYARDKYDEAVPVNAETATCWCAMGACIFATMTDWDHRLVYTLANTFKEIGKSYCQHL